MQAYNNYVVTKYRDNTTILQLRNNYDNISFTLKNNYMFNIINYDAIMW
jgi:hypothetical protein